MTPNMSTPKFLVFSYSFEKTYIFSHFFNQAKIQKVIEYAAQLCVLAGHTVVLSNNSTVLVLLIALPNDNENSLPGTFL